MQEHVRSGPDEHATFEMLEPRLLLDGTTYGDSFLELSDGGYAYLADGDVTDLDYTQDFSIETLVNIQPYTPAGRWAGVLTKMGNQGLYNSAHAGWGIGTSQGHLEQLGQSLVAKVGDGTSHAAKGYGPITGQVYAVMTWDVSESTLTLYINGEEEGASTNTAIVATNIENAHNLQIGKSLSELGRDIFLARMWNRELSSTEVATLWDELDISDGDGTGAHTLPSGFSTASLVSEWLMDEESDSGGGAGTTHIKDNAGSNHVLMSGNADLTVATGSLALNLADSATGVDKAVFLNASGGRGEFTSPAGPMHYYFQVDEVNTFTSDALMESGWVSHFSEYKPILKPSTTYYWRAKVKDSASTPQESSYTSTRSFTTEAAETWYVRPDASGGTYSSEDGTSYADAWNGFKAIEWGADGVEAGDTLYLCGSHVWERDTNNFWATIAQEFVEESGFSEEYPITIRMDYSAEAGHLWSSYLDKVSNGGSGVIWSYDGTYGVYYTDDISTGASVLYEDCDQGASGTYVEKVTLEGGEDPGDLSAGEFCAYDPGGGDLLYLNPHTASDPTDRIFQGGSGYRFVLSRASHVVFKNCNFYVQSFSAEEEDDTDTDLPISTYVTWDGSNFKYVAALTPIRITYGQDHWTIKNCDMEHVANGVYVVGVHPGQADYVTVQNCTFAHMGYAPFYHQDAHAIGIQGGNNHLIEGNYCEDTGTAIELYSGIYQEMKDNVVRYNFIKDAAHRQTSGSGVVISGTHTDQQGNRTGNVVYGNIALNCEGNGVGTNAPDLVKFYNNVAYSVDEGVSAWTRDYGPYWQGANNVFISPATRYAFFSNGHGTTDWSLDWDYNLYYPATGGSDFYHLTYGYMSLSEWQSNTGADAHAINSDPKFDVQGGSYDDDDDFMFLWDSPAIDAGEDWGQTVDYAGNPMYGTPDVGAYEYQPPYTMGTDSLELGTEVRLYQDGKFRNLESASGSDVGLEVEPNAGWSSYSATQARPFWADVEVGTWGTSGTYYRSWTVDDGANDWSSYATKHTVGGLAASTVYNVKVGGALDGTYTSDGAGELEFTYTGSNYDNLAFELEEAPVVTLTATDASAAEESSDTGTFRVSRGTETSGELSVNYSVSGTAADGDYSETLGGTVTITDGNTYADITITPVDDGENEGAETVILTLTSGTGYAVGSPSSDTVTITDNDDVEVTITATDASAAEQGSDTGTFQVSRGTASTGNLSVNYSVSGTAAGGDYSETLGGAVTITDGNSSADITVTPVDDGDAEGDETVILTLSSGAGYAVGSPDSATVTIEDDDETIEFVSPTPADEAIATSATITATTDIGSSNYAFIDWDEDCVLWMGMDNVDGSGNPNDSSTYTNDGTIAGDATQTTAGQFGDAFTFDGDGDYINLGNEAEFDFTNTTDFSLSAWVYKTDSTDQSGIFVKGNVPGYSLFYHEADRWQFMLMDGTSYKYVTSADANPGDKWVHLVGTYDASTNEAKLYVDGSLADTSGTASFGDFSNASSLKIGAFRYGSSQNWQGKIDDALVFSRALDSMEVAALYDAGTTDPSHTASGLTGSFDYQANAVDANGTEYQTETRTVYLDPYYGGDVTVSATDASAAEESSDTGTFRLSRGQATVNDLVVNYSVSGTASGGDYSETLGGSVTILDGNTSADITITPVDDSDIEADETVILTLASGTGYTVGSPSSDTVTIADNEDPEVTISATDASAAEEGSDTGTFQVSRSATKTSGNLAVNYSVSGTAESGDYSETLSGSVTILDGNTSADITITPVDDSTYEDDETVILTLTSGTGYTVGSPSSDTVTIADDDEGIRFVPPTPADGATVTEAGVYADTDITGDEYAFIDWDEDCVLWMGMDDVDGSGNPNDSSTYTNDGTIVGDATQTTAGQFGDAFTFDGAGDYVNLGNDAEFDFTNTTDFSLSAWVYKTDSTDQSGIFVKGNNPSYSLFYHGAKRWQFMIWDGTNYGYVTSADAAPGNKWVHLAATFDGSTAEMKLYVDGDLEDSGTAGAVGDFSNASSLKIGAFRYGGPEWQGMIDDVVIVRRVLDSTEVAALYDADSNSLSRTWTGDGTFDYQANAVGADGTEYQTEVRTVTLEPAMRLAGEPNEGAIVGEVLTGAPDRRLIVAAAVSWIRSGVRGVMPALRGLNIVVMDLGGTTLGKQSGDTIYLDDDAAGYGWFVDETPFDSSEFTRTAAGDLVAEEGSAAHGKVDLLTVLTHELGHAFGEDHSDDPTDVMFDALAVSQRLEVA